MSKLVKFLIICFAIFIAFNIWKNYDNKIKEEQTNKTNAKWLKTAAQRYYESQITLYNTMNKALNGVLDKQNIKPDVTTAEKVMNLCVRQLDIAHCEKVINGTIWIGEPKLWEEATMGPYVSSKNTTTLNGLIREQWVYGDPLHGATYVYFDNDKVSSWQTSE